MILSKHITDFLERAKKGDLVVIDEFLDSVDPEVSEVLVPRLLDKFGRLKSTVFIASHRVKDYDQYSKEGWTVLSPEYLVGDKIVPAKRLRRGFPEQGINVRYIKERHPDLFR